MSEQEYKDEIERLHRFIQRLAEHLYLAAEVLSNRAERRNKDERQARTTYPTGSSIKSADADQSKCPLYGMANAQPGYTGHKGGLYCD